MTRTEEEKVLQAPIVVTLGGQEYSIKPLVIRDAREWRRKVAASIRDLPGVLAQTSEDPDAFGRAMDRILVDNADMVIDLFFEYAHDLPREEIEATATEHEISIAWEQVREIAFPLVMAMLNMAAATVPGNQSGPPTR